MKRKRRPRNSDISMELVDDDTPEIVRAWILQVLLRLGGYRRMMEANETGSSEVLDALGISDDATALSEPRPLVSRLKRLAAEYPMESMSLPTQLAGNIERVGNLLGLTPVERRLLGFAVLSRTERALAHALDLLGPLSTARIYRVIAVVIDAPDKDVREALGPRGTLCRTGLLTMDRDGMTYLQHKIDVLSEGFAERMTSTAADPADLLRDKVFPSLPPTLALADFPHVQTLADVTRSHLSHALRTGRQGTNVLLHGAPGVGKTELARILAVELGVELFEISSEDDDGDPVDGDRRLRSYRAAQWFFANRKLIFLFDEVEDVFSGDEGFFKSRSSAQRRKAWMNRTLELNPIPTIWVSNRVDCLDPAFVRRFDIVMELPNPPLPQREKIIRRAADGLALDDSLMARMAAESNLTPAVVARAAEVAAVSAGDSGMRFHSTAMELLVNSTLRAQGHSGMPKVSSSHLPSFYDPRFINADVDLGALAEQLNPASSARILLHGSPGTGKTAYARWLTQRLGVPLLVKRASDLLSMYVGQAERNLAEAFEEASRDGAALLLDEVDSFLQDRRNARASWEVSMVNEMLTQMESFPGLMLATTNLAPALDQASLRRFDLKVAFHALRPDQSWEIFTRVCISSGIVDINPHLEEKVRQLHGLVPGDCAVVLRLHALTPLASSNSVYAALVQEQSAKEPIPRRIGFT